MPELARPYTDLLEARQDEVLWALALLEDLGHRLHRVPGLLDHLLMSTQARDHAGLTQLAASLGRPPDPTPEATAALAQRATLLAARRAATDPPLPVAALGKRLSLSRLETEILTLLWVLQTNPEADRLARLLWPDQAAGTGLDVIVVTLGRSLALRDSVLAALERSAPLRRLRLVMSVADTPRWPRLALPEAVMTYLGGRRPALASPFEHLDAPPRAPYELLLPSAPAETTSELEALCAGSRIDSAAPRIILQARAGAAVTDIVRGLAARDGAPVVRCDVGRYLREHPRAVTAFEDGVRDAVLLGAWCLLEAPGVWPPDSEWQVELMASSLAKAPIPVVLACEVADIVARKLLPNARRVVIQPLGSADLITLWLASSPERPPPPRKADLRAVLADYELSAESILIAAPDAARRAEADGTAITRHHLVLACQAQLEIGFGDLATPVATPFDLDQLVVPDGVRDQLLEILLMGRHKSQVMQAWGFEKVVPYGAGITVLFSGPSGTGKTMAATIIARRLERPLYRVDLSRIFDRYVGETEKNLAKIFEAARSGHAIILFDEADALFSKRTEVKSSNDRYANLEVNYLLQRIEQHAGVVILTTNLDSSIDEAFRRRIRHTVRFPRPDADARETLWRSMVPARAATAAIDWGLVAYRYELPGGAIKNAMLRAAYLAAGEGSPITFAHVERAAFAECAALGLLVKRGG